MDEKQIYEFMKIAISEAENNAGLDLPIAALLVKDGEIIARAGNRRERDADPLAHAEMLSIRAAAMRLGNWRLSGCTIFVTLEPCPMCCEAILQSRIERIVFAAYDPQAGACGSRFNLLENRQALPSPELIAGILEEEASSMLKEFFKKRRAENKRK